MSARTRRATGRVFLNLAAVVVFVCSVFPVYWMVNTAFLPGSAVKSETPHFWPDQFTLRSFQAAWEGGFVPALWVSLAVTLLTVVAALVFAFLASIAVSRYRFRSRKSFIVAILVIQMIPAEAMIISTFRVLDGWHLLNTVIGLSAVYIAMVLPFTIWTLRGFVNGIPADLEEAAMIDGCSRTQAFWRVTFPLLAPGLVSTGIFAFIQAWNEFIFALVIMTRPESQTLPIWLRSFVQATKATDWAVVMAGSTLMAIPVIVFFLIVQGKMTSGLVSGAVKG
ncbi:carbohydrate ABC transporter permease [Microbacterium hominis]|uniref:Carbohydrate ABC transporter permease n=1 Tax=Microbacterium hominis TaxID=162426 RepID=A0A134DEB4_9MICO|nr:MULTISPECIES: carbohydrate ABC transporter permease [Microbacterium]AUG30547.1 carbohydrate ABC transporter permease [Microbacterium hominis]KXC04883.1 sugar ABC transporter permease [Microbacterium hominis]QOC26309.1 carbohydrate ABC transporter permease [Microbacterium hominis]QOC30254.1 carbohydrate ABC transporter permease [Microbacterium hominis]QRY41830.1 carbohydrate ABC transporter permease [Microbacterium hominis]